MGPTCVLITVDTNRSTSLSSWIANNLACAAAAPSAVALVALIRNGKGMTPFSVYSVKLGVVSFLLNLESYIQNIYRCFLLDTKRNAKYRKSFFSIKLGVVSFLFREKLQ